jgi:hypothetical protein
MGKLTNLAGKKFGHWTVLELDPKRAADGEARWRCSCDCSTKRIVSGNSLRRGRSKSCGKCLWLQFIGKTFGRWTVVEVAPQRAADGWKVLCCCTCGVKRIVNGNSLRWGQSKSCGVCYKKKHNQSKASIYRRWTSMKQRCFK